MVEMRETSDILRLATSRSLIILDEIGRGTSTYDGLSIAWAVSEYIDQQIEARCLFATHYHELAHFAELSPTAKNVSVSAEERNGELVFLHRIAEGAVHRSYGVAVARLAGLPQQAIDRAEELLENFSKYQSEAKPNSTDQCQSVELMTASEIDSWKLSDGSTAIIADADQKIAAQARKLAKPAKRKSRADSGPLPPDYQDPRQLGLFGTERSGAEDRALYALKTTELNLLTPLQAMALIERLQRELEKKS